MRPPESGYQLFFFCTSRTQWKVNEDIAKGIRRTPICVQNEQGFPSDPQSPLPFSGQGSRVPQSHGLSSAPRQSCSVPCVHNSHSCCARLVCHLQHRTAHSSIYNRARPERRPHRKVSTNQRRWNGQRQRLICHPNFQPTLLVKPNVPWPALPKGSGECHGAAAGLGAAPQPP